MFKALAQFVDCFVHQYLFVLVTWFAFLWLDLLFFVYSDPMNSYMKTVSSTHNYSPDTLSKRIVLNCVDFYSCFYFYTKCMKYLSVYNEYPLVSISYDAALTLFQHFPNAYYLTSSENTTCDTVFLLRDIRKMFHCSSLNELQLPPMMTLKEPPCTSFFTTNNKKYFYHALQNHFDDFVMMIKFQSYENSYSGFLTKYFIPLLTQTIPSSYFSLYEFLMSQCLPYSHFFENFVTCFSEKLVEIISSCECNPTSTFQNFYDSFIELKTTLSQVNSSFIHPSTDCLDSPSIHGKLFLDDEVISNESPDSTPLTPIVSTISVVPLSNFNLTDFSSGCICVPSIALSISCSDMSCDFYFAYYDLMYSDICVITSCYTSCSLHVYACLFNTCMEYLPYIPSSFHANSDFIYCLCILPSKKFFFYILQCFVDLLVTSLRVYSDSALFDFEHILHSLRFDIQLYNLEFVKDLSSCFIYCYLFRSLCFVSKYNIMNIITCFIRTPCIMLYSDTPDTSPILSCLRYSSW